MPFVNRLDSWNFGFGITGYRVRREVQPRDVEVSADDTGDKEVRLGRGSGETGDRREVKLLEPLASGHPASGISGNGKVGEASSERRESTTAPRLSDSEDTDNVKRFSLASLNDATKEFSSENVIGEGGFGTVYKVIII